MSNFIQPLGPDGVNARIQQLENRLNGLDPAGNPQPSFQQTLSGAIDNPNGSAGIVPMSPFGTGTQLQAGAPDPKISSYIQQAAVNNGLDPKLLNALVATESDYSPDSRSSAGAMGLTQLMPDTARQMGVQNPFDPVENLNGGAKYLKGLIGQFGSLPLALAAYNAGPNAVLKHGGIPPYPETQNYVKKILSRMSAN